MKHLKPRLILFLFLLLPVTGRIRAEEKNFPPRLSVKTNILYWATTTPNLSVEYAMTGRLTLNVAGSYNPWQFGNRQDNKKIKHWIVQPELRYWVCEKFNGGFWGGTSSVWPLQCRRDQTPSSYLYGAG